MDDIFPYFAVLFLKVLVRVSDLITDLLFGWTIEHGTRDERTRSETTYESSAHVVDIVLKGRSNPAYVHGSHNYLYKHNRYADPSLVTSSPNVFLVGAGADEAVFAVCDAGFDAYDTRETPFMIMEAFEHFRQLVIVRAEHFHRLADEVGDPRVKTALVGMTARCGSTLIAQIINR